MLATIPLRPGTDASPAARRVLVVDDHADYADTLAMLVRLWDHQAHVAYRAHAALADAPAFRPDVVLLDIGLPDMDGWELARRLRGQPGGPALLLVAVTGYGNEADRERSR